MKASPIVPALTPTRACDRCPRCRSYVWTGIKNSFAGRFEGVEVCCACLLAIVTMEVI